MVHDFYTFLLVFCRVAGVLTTSPLLGNRGIPRPALAGFTLVFSLALTPLIAPHTGPIPGHLLLLALHVVQNAVFGMALGFLARVLFASVEMAGYFVDTQMGFGFINLVNPFSEQQSSLMSMFQYQLAVTVYLLMNGHLMLIGSMAQSFAVLPPDAIAPHSGFGMAIVPILKMMFRIGLHMALPAIGVLTMVDMSFGLVARTVPQINIFIVGMPAKILMGMITVAMLLPIISAVVGQLIVGTDTGLGALIAGAK